LVGNPTTITMTLAFSDFGNPQSAPSIGKERHAW